MEMVMNEIDPREEPGSLDEQVSGCTMLDSCADIRNEDSLYNVLTHNFIRLFSKYQCFSSPDIQYCRHYEQNRAPLGLYLHAAWFVKSPEMMDALLFWLDEVLRSYDDVYIVSMSQVLAWMQSPTSSNQAVQFPPWLSKCSSLDTPDTCEVRFMSWKINYVGTLPFQFSNAPFLSHYKELCTS